MKQLITTYQAGNTMELVREIEKGLHKREIMGFNLIIDSISHAAIAIGGGFDYTAIVVTHFEPIDKP